MLLKKSYFIPQTNPNKVYLLDAEGNTIFTSKHKEEVLRKGDEHPEFVEIAYANNMWECLSETFDLDRLPSENEVLVVRIFSFILSSDIFLSSLKQTYLVGRFIVYY